MTSLPSLYGIGDLGPGAYRFADFLQAARQRIWQILPLNPTTHGNSPYYSPSAFACNSLLISPQQMIREGFIEDADLPPVPKFPPDRVHYPSVIEFKTQLFDRAYARFKTRGPQEDYEKFCGENSHWLQDYALFTALKRRFAGESWNTWPTEIRHRQPQALDACIRESHETIEREKFLQFVFYRQWTALKTYCREKGISILGDIPIYVTHDSADVWAYPELFKLDAEMNPAVVAGVPPDYFSETGQLWGNPVYNWDRLKQQKYDWWIRRMERNLRCFDLVRIDHFRGLVAAWEIPAHEKTAENGRWQDVPAKDFFAALLERVPVSSIIAEDLGYITPDVREVMHEFGFPGMKLLVFAFGEDVASNPYAPHNHVKNCVVYTGTHDCNTVKGWFENELSPEDKSRLSHYLGRSVSSKTISREMVRLAMMSVADTAVVPMQDILGLGVKARMNRPATLRDNWQWRLSDEHLTADLHARLRDMTELFGRD